MSEDISGQGLEINLVASKVFPGGLIINQFADDADPLDFSSIQIADDAMGLNGDDLKFVDFEASRYVILPPEKEKPSDDIEIPDLGEL